MYCAGGLAVSIFRAQFSLGGVAVEVGDGGEPDNGPREAQQGFDLDLEFDSDLEFEVDSEPLEHLEYEQSCLVEFEDASPAANRRNDLRCTNADSVQVYFTFMMDLLQILKNLGFASSVVVCPEFAAGGLPQELAAQERIQVEIKVFSPVLSAPDIGRVVCKFGIVTRDPGV